VEEKRWEIKHVHIHREARCAGAVSQEEQGQRVKGENMERRRRELSRREL